MRAAGRALRIAPAGMTPPVTGEGRAYDIERGQFDHLTRIRDEESGSTPGYSGTLDNRFGAPKGRRYCDAPIPMAGASGLYLADLAAF